MQADLHPGPIAEFEGDALAAVLFEREEGRPADPALDGWTAGLLSELYASGEFKGKPLDTSIVHRPAGLKAPRLLLVGGGKRAEFSPAKLRRAAGAAGRKLKNSGVKRLGFIPVNGLDPAAQARAIVEGVALAQFEPDAYKTRDRTEGAVERLSLLADSGQAALAQGLSVAAAQNRARVLANEPGNRLPPRVLAERARELAEEAGLEIEVLEQSRLEELGMGALLGVARGSEEPPALMVLRYRPQQQTASETHLGLVGKAVTFDTGGISIKPSAEMDRMKYDMAGGAAVLGAMQAIAALRPAVPVTAVIPSVENMPGGRAQRPGDVVTTFSGKTVEVLNTDAEGRLILCDALSYARELGCNRLVDAATLTGAIVVALGHERAGLFSNDESWQARVSAAAEAAGEKLWPMPMDEEYREELKSGVADLPNIGSRWGGSITAALFLKEFADPTPWAHLDIAGTAWLERDQPDLPKGPTGIGVRTLVELALSL